MQPNEDKIRKYGLFADEEAFTKEEVLKARGYDDDNSK